MSDAVPIQCKLQSELTVFNPVSIFLGPEGVPHKVPLTILTQPFQIYACHTTNMHPISAACTIHGMLKPHLLPVGRYLGERHW